MTEQLAILAAAMGESLTPARLRIYLSDLRDVDAADLAVAFTRARRELKFFPKIAELWQFARVSRVFREHGALAARAIEQAEQAPQLPESDLKPTLEVSGITEPAYRSPQARAWHELLLKIVRPLSAFLAGRVHLSRLRVSATGTVSPPPSTTAAAVVALPHLAVSATGIVSPSSSATAETENRA